MNKILIALLVFGGGALIIYLMAGNTDGLPTGTQTNDDVSYEEVAESLKEDGARKVVGNCNAIAEKSSCVDYIGSMWADADMAELNCKGVGTYSNNTCPYSEFGGCQTSAGSVMEMIVWAYREGPGEYNEESVPYAIAVCNANPAAQWVTPEEAI